MTTRAPRDDFDEQRRPPTIEPPETWATGIPAVLAALKRTQQEMSPVATARTLTKLNHTDGFDCPGCAWPDPDPEHRKLAEFCENGAKHVAAEATGRRLDADFFARYPIKELAGRSDWWLEEQGRLVEPVVKRPGSDHFEVATWDAALDLVASETDGPRGPGSGRLLHVGAGEQRSRLPLSAVRPGLWHQQPAGLLQHVPRVQRHGPQPGHRGRQGQLHPGGPRARRADRDLRAESGEQPPSHADATSSGPNTTVPPSWRSIRSRRPGCCASRTRSRPAARWGRAPPLPTTISRFAWPATRPCSSVSASCCWRPRRRPRGRCSTTPSSAPTPTGFAAYRDHAARADWAEIEAASGLPRAADRGPGPPVAGVPGHHRVLGHGAHPAPQLGGHRSGRSPTPCCSGATSGGGAPASSPCGATATCRAIAPWASGRRCPIASSMPSGTSSVSTRPGARAGMRSRRSRPCATAGPGSCSPSAATWCGPSPTRRWPRRPSAPCGPP